MLRVEAVMLLELLHVMRRWPSVAAAVSIHFLLVGMVMMTPAPGPDTPVPPDDPPIPTFYPPQPKGGGPKAEGPKHREPKDVGTKKPVPTVLEQETLVEETAEVEASEPTDATAESSTSQGTVGDSESSDTGGNGTGGDSIGPGTGDGPPGDSIGPAEAEPPSGSQPIPMSSRVEGPVLIERVEPAYPNIARVAGVDGLVVIDCVIGADGRVTVRGIGKSIPLLDAAAVSAVEKWRYQPARLNGRPQAVYLSVKVAFSLDR